MTGLFVREQRIEVLVGQAVRMLAGRLQLHQVDDVDHADLQLRQVLAQQLDRRQHFQRRHVAGGGHDHVGLAAVRRCWPTPRCRCPPVQCLTAWSMFSHCGAGCLPATTTLT